MMRFVRRPSETDGSAAVDLKAKLLARALEFLTLADGQREPGAAVGDETEAGHRHRHRLSALYRGST